MMYYTKARYDLAIKSVTEDPMICRCGEEMKPMAKRFDKEKEFPVFLRVVCSCGHFLKSSIFEMPNEWNFKQGYRRRSQINQHHKTHTNESQEKE